MKKSGIILSIFFVIIALLICVFVLKGSKDKEESPPTDVKVENVQQNVEQQSTQQQPVEQQPVQQPVQQQPVPQQPVQQPSQTTVIEKVITKEISGVQTISEGTLGVPVEEKEVIVYISNKRILLIDEDTDSAEPKMLSYCFDVLTPENDKLVLFMTQSSYTQFNVNDKLKVKYAVYKNDKGIEFPLVLNVSTVE